MIKVCEVCNKKFESSSPNQKYCSDRCRFNRQSDFEIEHCRAELKKYWADFTKGASVHGKNLRVLQKEI